jgi:hypothetical protein
MNVNIFLAIFTLSFYTANAQVQITTLNDKHNHSFPLICSKNKSIANNINGYLQNKILTNERIETSTDKIFENSKYINEDTIQQSGYQSIDYKVEMNNYQILSLCFKIESTGAYTSYYDEYYSFNLETGKMIVAKDLFTTAGLNYLRKYLVRERKNRIDKFIKEELPPIEDSAYVIERYENCNQEADENNIYITSRGVVFYKEYCFPHSQRPFDTDLDIIFKIKQLEKYLTESGKKLLLLKK